jgi:hypothetical protein
MNGYVIINCNFQYPIELKYPSIPCYIDKTTTIYLSGSCLLTGPEYLLAKNQGCELRISLYFTSCNEVKDSKGNAKEVPILLFHSILKEIQRRRSENSKGTIMNLIYKEMGNSISGKVVRG